MNKSEHLNKIIKEAIKHCLNEMASPVVWHFCWFDNITSILRTNMLKLSLSEINTDKVPGSRGYSNKHPYYLCTTRSKNSFEGYSNIVSNDNREGYARIQLNGDKLNNICHAKASDYFGNREDNMIAGKRALYKGIEQGHYSDKPMAQNYKNIGSIRDNEKEDTIWYYKPYIKNASKYIERVDILVYDEQSFNENKQVLLNIKKYANRLSIPIFFYTNIKDFDMQNNNTIEI